MIPPLAGLFDVAALSAQEWLATAGFSLAPAVIVRMQAWLNDRLHRGGTAAVQGSGFSAGR